MSNTFTIIGNLASDPVLRSAKERPVASFRLASNRRYYDTSNNEWKESQPLFLEVTCWGSLATNVAESVHKEDPVIATGRLSTETFTPAGEDRSVSVTKMTATTVGVDLRYVGENIGTGGDLEAVGDGFLPDDTQIISLPLSA